MKRLSLLSIIIIISAMALLAGASYTVYETKGIILDNSTGLYWTRCSITFNDLPSSGINCTGYNQRFRWTDAISVCSRLDFGGRSDWRLPSIKELQSIVKYNTTNINIISFNENVFPGTSLDHYWSSTTHKKDANVSWTIDFHFGSVTYHAKKDPTTKIENEFYVRCVAGPDEQ